MFKLSQKVLVQPCLPKCKVSSPPSIATTLISLNCNEQKQLNRLIRLWLIYLDKKFIIKFIMDVEQFDKYIEPPDEDYSKCKNSGYNANRIKNLQQQLFYEKALSVCSDILKQKIVYKKWPTIYIKQEIGYQMRRFFGVSFSKKINKIEAWELIRLLELLIDDEDYMLDLSGIPLYGLNLDNVSMNMVNLEHTNLWGVDFSCARFESYMRLNVFDNLEYLYKEHSRKTSCIDFLDFFLKNNFDHFHNKSYSLLKTIDSIDNIDEIYISVKLDALYQVICWFYKNNVNISIIILPLIDIFISDKDRVYFKHKMVRKFIVKDVLPRLTSEINSGELDLRLYDIKIQDIYNYIIKLPENERQDLLFKKEVLNQIKIDKDTRASKLSNIVEQT